jgi:hypothetical protein
MMRRYKRPVVQLTSLLDLLFVMIFVSLMQTKTPPSPSATAAPEERPVPITEVSPKTEAAPRPQGKIAVTGMFHFHATSKNPQIPSGKYSMEGTFNHDTGHLQLGGIQWIKRPENYGMVPLKGKINSDKTIFTGTIEFPGCKEFKLVRTPHEGSPIAGKWQGSYVCSQGETGLTLTIY